jgi:RNA polymerase sigma-70 factor, ECF subfamily
MATAVRANTRGGRRACASAPAAPVRLVLAPRHESPEELALLAQEGSVEAFERLVAQFEARVFNFLLRRVRASDAEDLTQDTFIRAWERIHQYSPRWRFSTWLFTIAMRQAASRARRERAHAAIDNVQPAAAGAEIDAAMVRHEERGRIWAVVDETLGQEQRTAVWLRYVEDMSMQDIARVLGKSQVAVRVMLHRARLALAEAFRESGAAEGVGPCASSAGEES